MINELELIEHMDMLNNHTIVFYGAGRQGERMLRELRDRDITVHYFCDSNVKKWGRFVSEVRIISHAMLKQLDRDEDLVIIITLESVSSVDEIADRLGSLNLRTKHISTVFALEQALRLRKSIDRETLMDRWERIVAACQVRQNWQFEMVKNLIMANHILVYQPGKVGSQTILNSLVISGVTDCFISGHLHTLNFPEIESNIKEMITLKLESMRMAGTIKIITLVREPISRDLSFLFQVMGPSEEKIPSLTGSFIDVYSERLRKTAFEGDFLFGRPSERYGFQFEWFDHEIKEIFGIDIFEYPFDREKGYSVIRQGDVEVLVMKLEKLNFLEQIISDFIGVPDFRLVNYNESSDKRYKYLYENVKEVIKISPDIISLYYKNNPRMDYFYTEEEKVSFLKKWEKNIG